MRIQLNSALVRELLDNLSISQNQLANQIGMSRGSLSNALVGRRGAGRKLLTGLLRTFPDKTLANLIINERLAKK